MAAARDLNPFRFSGPLASENMIDRDPEAEELLALAEGGHSFRYPRLETALRHLLGRWEEGAGTGEPGAQSAPERPALVL